MDQDAFDPDEPGDEDEWDERRPGVGRQALWAGLLALPFAMVLVVGLAAVAIAVVVAVVYAMMWLLMQAVTSGDG